jgi:uncharacterized membrane protein
LMGLLMGVTITTLELVAGLVWNREHKIWDYSKLPLNIKGQVCLPFTLIWAVAMPFVIVWLDKTLK